MDSTLGIVSLVCYLGGVCDFHNQLQTSLTGTKLDRVAKGLKAFTSPAMAPAMA